MEPDEHAQSSQAAPEVAPSSRENDVHLAATSDRAREAIIRSYRIIKVPDYFLDEWLPLLGPSRWLAVLAFRQVAFVHKCQEKSGSQSTQTTYRQLAMWAGQSRPQMHKLLKNPRLLSWFVQPQRGVLGEHPGSRSNRRTYMVRIEIPLTPTDQARLQAFLHSNRPTDDEGWLQLLHNALSAKRTELPQLSSLPNNPKSIQQMVHELRDPSQPLPEEVDWACDELLERWQTQNFGQVTHYFVRNWLPELTPGLGCLLIWCRRHANRQREGQIGRLSITQWSTLAKAVGMSTKSVRRWFSQADKYPQVRLFMEPLPFYTGVSEVNRLEHDQISVNGKTLSISKATLVKHDLHVGDLVDVIAEQRDGALHAVQLRLALDRNLPPGLNQTGTTFEVKLTEPVHPKDQSQYRSLLESGRGSAGDLFVLPATGSTKEPNIMSDTEISERTKIDKAQTKVDDDRSDVTSVQTQVNKHAAEVDSSVPIVSLDDPDVDELLTPVDKEGTDINALRGDLRDNQETIKVGEQEQQRIPSLTKQLSQVQVSSPKVVVGSYANWDIDQILTLAGIPRRDKRLIKSKWNDAWPNFVAWLLWGLSTKSIEAPVVHAISRVKRKEIPPPDYIQLALIEPLLLEKWLGIESFDYPSQFRRAIGGLRKNDSLSRLLDIGFVKSMSAEQHTFREYLENKSMDHATLQSQPINGELDEPFDGCNITPREAWEATSKQLKMKLQRAEFDTWIRDIEIDDFQNGDTLVLAVGNEYARDWLQDQVTDMAKGMLAGIAGRPIDVKFEVLSP